MSDSKEDERAKSLGDMWRQTQQAARIADEQTNALWRELRAKSVRRSPADKMIRGRDLLNK